ncbi:ParB/Srx family N-terminal domain-containing protein [uncultured Desulfovibrio sp.]|uniref:ParB/Srx family N-terminal domain-containing protein n=1 Tax=uncultured Desulfovibrio sp. TaxID=167968 RepID=UPI0026099755|nr:ParB/Srx family N-terminal domain-containing protein [uncultured Desulfovibrio sp.]
MEAKLDIKIEHRSFSELHFLQENAHYMDKREFDQLVSNIKRDGVLTSLPVVYDGDIPGEILSGNHRVKAAIAAGLEGGNVIVVRTPLTRDQKLAIQLSHNSIHGKDDPNLLSKLFSEIISLELKEYSGLTDDDFKVAEVELVPLSFAQPESEIITLAFLGEDLKIFEDHLKKLEKIAQKNPVYLASMKNFDDFHRAVFKTKNGLSIINTSLAIMMMTKLALQKLAEMEAANEEG